MKTKNILYGALGLGGLFVGYLILKNKKNKTEQNSQTPKVDNKPVLTDNYSNSEATKKALITVKDWIKTYDNLPQDILNQKSNNQTFFENRLNELKAKTNPTTADSNEIQLLTQKLSNNKYLLKDRINILKNEDYQKVYNVLKDLYSEYPKADVDKLMVILPKVLGGLMLGDDFKYSSDLFDKLTIDEKLYLSDTDFFGKFQKTFGLKYPKRVFVTDLDKTKLVDAVVTIQN